MKKTSWLSLLIVLLISCRKDNPPAVFEMIYPNQVIEIQAGLNVFESHYYTIPRIPTRYLNLLDQNGLNDEDVLEIVPTNCRLTNISSNAPYDFLFEVSVRIYNEDEPGRKFEIFYDDRVPLKTGNLLNLIPNPNNVKEILSKEHFNLEIVLVRLRDTPQEFIETRVELTFDAR